jgi:hypothetical protein
MWENEGLISPFNRKNKTHIISKQRKGVLIRNLKVLPLSFSSYPHPHSLLHFIADNQPVFWER